VYPALAVLNALRDRVDRVLWVGSESGMEAALIARAGLPYAAIPTAGLHGVNLRSLPGNLIQIARGIKASWAVLKDFNPDILFFTGGYVAVPMALAALKHASVLYIPDIEPGLALKALARFSTHIAITAEETRHFLPANATTTVTGYPTRPELAGREKGPARKQLGLEQDQMVLLVFGGSKGAHSINQAILTCLPQLLEKTQIIHITGSSDLQIATKTISKLRKGLRDRYHPYSYLHDEMGAAFASADLAVCRAGASTLGELPLFGLPALLIPYPHAWRYQQVNAEYLADRGAAVVMQDSRMSKELLPTLNILLADRIKLGEMQKAMHALSVSDAAGHIAQIILDTAKARNHD
jgi:UDP-N-acetylglucosamine--N-acetylmuramyl-(pentapeptide) pyrophosphoryl-undecaprenol N-acetylglucosamine transferase